MAQLDKNTLKSLQGRLGRAFRQTRLDALKQRFLAAAGSESRAVATAAITQFQNAAQRLHGSERAFYTRARAPRGSKPGLLKHLRTPEQLAAVRAFSMAKQALLTVNPDLGRRIISLTTAGDVAVMRPAARPAVTAAQL